MVRAAVLVVLTALAPFVSEEALAQSVSRYAPVIRTTGITYTSIAGTGTSVSGWRNGVDTDDNRSTPQPIGFTFYYVGRPCTTFSVSTNGYMDFSSSAAGGIGTGAYGYQNSMFSAVEGTLLALAPMYDNHVCEGDPGTAAALDAAIKYQMDGAPGSRVLTVQWTGLEMSGNSSPDLNMQVTLYEATGVIEYVYGTMTPGTVTRSYTLGINGPNLVSPPWSTQLLTQQTANSTTFSNTPSNALTTVPTSNSRLTFTPVQNVTPAVPTSMTFSSVTQGGMTVGWTDSSTTETYFVVSRSTDNIAFTQVGTITSTTVASTGTTYSLAQTGLAIETTYYFRVTANNEGSPPSDFLSGSQATNPAADITSLQSGNWSAGTTWVGGVLPSQYDDVTIADGDTVTIGANAFCHHLNVGQGSSGVLQWGTGLLTLTAAGDVTIAPGGTFKTGDSGAATTHSLTVYGDLTNNGTLDFSTFGDVCRAGIVFAGPSDAVFGGTGGTTDISTLTVNKGVGSPSTLELSPSNFTVQGLATDSPASAFLTLTHGTLRISGTFAGTHRVFTAAAYSVAAGAGIWLDNPNFTVAGQNGNPTVSGLWRITQGAYDIGASAGSAMNLGAGSVTIIEGGAVTATGSIRAMPPTAGISYHQSGGTVTVCTVENTSGVYASFDMGTSASSEVEMSGGEIVLQLPCTGGEHDYRNGSLLIPSGGTLRVGDASTGAAGTYHLQGVMPNLIVTNDFDHAVHIGGAAYALDVTNNTGNTLDLDGNTLHVLGSTFTNDGILTGKTQGSGLYFRGSGAALARSGHQTFTGTGTIAEYLLALSIDNPSGVSITSDNQLVTARVNLFTGTVTNSSRITIGYNEVATGVTQIGSNGFTGTGGSYDQAPTFDYVPGRYDVLYEQEGAGRTTGFEIPPERALRNLQIDNTNGVTVSGGGLSVTSALLLTAGTLTTTATDLLTLTDTVTPPGGSAASFVNGPMAIEWDTTPVTAKTYAIGTGSDYAPVSVTFASVTSAGYLTAATAAGDHVQIAGSGLDSTRTANRIWTLTNSGTGFTTCGVTLNFVPGDLDEGADPERFEVRRYASSAWTSPTTGDRTGTSTEATELTGFGDFAVGQTFSVLLTTGVVGGGSLTVDPDQPAYDLGDSVEITACPGDGWQFDQWTGSASGSDNPLTVVMDGDKSITAVFIDIAPPEAQLTAPNGGEVWSVGVTQPITWSATDNAGVTAIDLEYSTDGGTTYPIVIAAGLADSGSYDWVIPANPTTDAKVRVTAHDAAGGSVQDESDFVFSIEDVVSVQALFCAEIVGDRDVVLWWLLPDCYGALGVRVYRAPTADGPFGCITPAPLPCHEAGAFVDATAWPGVTFWYELRAVLESGDEVLAIGARPSITVPGALTFGIRSLAPNPTQGGASIGYTLPAGSRSARLSVYDVAGRLIRRLDSAADASGGFFTVEWDGRGGSGERPVSGVYFVRLEADGAVAMQKLTVVR